VYVIASPTRGGSSNNLDVLATVDPVTANLTDLGSLTALNDVVPACFALIPPDTAVVCSFSPSTGFCLNEISLANGSAFTASCFGDLQIKNVQYDAGHRHVYFEAVNKTTQASGLYQWAHRTDADLIAALPGDIKWGVSAISTHMHTMFLITQGPCPTGLCFALVAVNVDTGDISTAPITTGVDVSVLALHEYTSVLYAIVASTKAPQSDLVSVDIQTGALSTAIATFQNFSSAGSVGIDLRSNTLFAPLNVMHKKEKPFFVHVDLTTGKYFGTQMHDKKTSFIRSLAVL